ncbi:MAG: hydroxymyristoyl-ACP dehydratase [Deltaproteobacteria bacterium]|nr:hydroxymyristoyl-ACP dehydratase [Deltaproteobacteria bacterium]TLN03630.1 MAG: hydroxymyristoyl-ACP dehydratase [bacterium]
MESILLPEPVVSSDPRDYLPHRNPFVFIDRVTSREPGISATGIKCVTNEPGGFPQVLLLESMAQLGGIAAATEKGEGGFLASIDHAEFSREVRVGDRLLVSVRVVKSFGRLFLMEGEAFVEGEKIAMAQLTLGVGKI